MDCKLRHDRTAVREKLCEGSEEKAVDLDFTLPDYCADIQKILKCRLKPKITARRVSGDRLELEGISELSVFYLDAAGERIRFCEKSVPFSAGIALRRPAANAVIETMTKVEYLNCRAVSSRRIDLHGAFSISAVLYESTRLETVCAIEEEDIEQKCTAVTLSESAAMVSHPFLVGSALEIGAGRSPVDLILRRDANAFLEDVKLLAGVAVVKGSLALEVLYLPAAENAQPEKLFFEIPFSETVDCPGADPDCFCETKLELSDTNLQIKPDSSGENTVLNFEARVIANLYCSRNRTVSAVTDAYSRDFETKLEYQTGEIRALCQTVGDLAPIRLSPAFETQEIESILDLWSEGLSVAFTFENGTLLGKGSCRICLLYGTKEGRPAYLETPEEFSFSREVRFGGALSASCEGSAALRPLEGKLLPGGTLEVRTQVCFTAALFTVSDWKTVSAVYEEETKEKHNRGENALSIYFAAAGEELWDIAKEHRASLLAIRAENPGAGETLAENTMLLIPT